MGLLKSLGKLVCLRGHERTKVGAAPHTSMEDIVGTAMRPGGVVYCDDDPDWQILTQTYTSDNTVSLWPSPCLSAGPIYGTAAAMSGIGQQQSTFTFTWPGTSIEPEKKKCNYCGSETADYRKLKIGRMTDVVICDMCQLKALSRVLGGGDDDGDQGPKGDPEHQSGEESCRHGPEEEENTQEEE